MLGLVLKHVFVWQRTAKKCFKFSDVPSRSILCFATSLLPSRGLLRDLNGLKCPTVRNFQRIQIPLFNTDEAILHLRETLAWRKNGKSRTEQMSHHSRYLSCRTTKAMRKVKSVARKHLHLCITSLFRLAFTCFHLF